MLWMLLSWLLLASDKYLTIKSMSFAKLFLDAHIFALIHTLVASRSNLIKRKVGTLLLRWLTLFRFVFVCCDVVAQNEGERKIPFEFLAPFVDFSTTFFPIVTDLINAFDFLGPFSSANLHDFWRGELEMCCRKHFSPKKEKTRMLFWKRITNFNFKVHFGSEICYPLGRNVNKQSRQEFRELV